MFSAMFLCFDLVRVGCSRPCEGLVEALLATQAAATVYMDCKRTKLVAAAAAAAFVVLDFCDGDFVDLVCDRAFFSSRDRSAAAFVCESCECGELAVAAAAATNWIARAP